MIILRKLLVYSSIHRYSVKLYSLNSFKSFHTTRTCFKINQIKMARYNVDLKWNITTDEIKTLTKSTIDESTKRCDKIAATEQFTSNNVLVPFNEMERIFKKDVSFLKLLSEVSPDKTIRDSCNDAVQELSKFSIEIRMRKDLFDVLQKFNDTNKEELDHESKRFVERSLIEGKQDGLHLDEETRNKVKELKKKISDLEVEFNKNVTEENSKFTFTKEQLDGVTEGVLNSLQKNENGDYVATLKYPVYYPIMKQCKVPETRSKMLVEFNSRCVNENTPLIEQLFTLRHQLANILGYKTYSEYALELCMAKNPQNVESFLSRLTSKLGTLLESELKILLKYKKEECEKLNIPFDNTLRQSDVTYYTNLREQIEFKVDHNKIQEYFPVDVVVNGTFDIYQTLLGLQYELVTEHKSYHDEVQFYQVKDKQTDEIVGYFYTDLYPREGKYGHAAVFPLISGCKNADSTRQIPVCAMVCNFTRATSDKPALLRHEEVETFFHEFGHVMHHMCAKANYCKFSGTSVERDFVEAPSQMLENWCWEKESLKLMSKHYKDGTPIDDQLLEDLIKTKQCMAGHFNLRQILFAKIDQIYHSNEKSDSKAIYNEYTKKLLTIEIENKKMNMVASFQHLAGGYQAKYYSYLWSEVFSQDMFDSRFKKEGVLNSKTGMDYRRFILQPGGSKDGKDMLIDFLGREPNEKAFLESKGLKVDE